MLPRRLISPLIPSEERTLLMIAHQQFNELEAGHLRRLLALGLIDEVGEGFSLTPAGEERLNKLASNVVIGPWAKRRA